MKNIIFQSIWKSHTHKSTKITVLTLQDSQLLNWETPYGHEIPTSWPNLQLQLPTRTWGPFEKNAGQNMGPVIYHILYKCSFPWAHYGGFLLCFHKTLCWASIKMFPSNVFWCCFMVCVIFFRRRRTQPAVCPLPSLLSVPYRDGNVAEHLPVQANNDVSELCCSDVCHVGHRQKESAHLLGVSSKTPFLLAEMEHSSAPSLAMKVCWGGWNPQVEMACVPPASGGRPPPQCGLSQETETALGLAEASVGFEPLYINWALF